MSIPNNSDLVIRPIRSFVRRDSRMTSAQSDALARMMVNFGLPVCRSATDLFTAFQHRAPVSLEIGSGDGAFMLSLAKQYPNENHIAVEVYRPGVGRLLHRCEQAGVENVRIFNDDVHDLLVTLIEPVFDRVFIFFPDPWPKKRHQKRRLLNQQFFDLLTPNLRRHARVFIATDSASYAESICEVTDQLPTLRNLAGARRFAPRPSWRPITKFEQRARQDRRTVFDFVFGRV